MIKKLIIFLIGKLNLKEQENLIYLILPKLTEQQKKNLADFLIRLTGSIAEGAAKGAVK